MSAQDLPTERTPSKVVAYERSAALEVTDQLEHLGHWAIEKLFDPTKRSRRLPSREARDVIQAFSEPDSWRADKRPFHHFPELALLPELAPQIGVVPQLVTHQVTHLAWHRPTFQIALQRVTREHLRSKWLFTRERETQIQHHPALGWCLLLLALNLRRIVPPLWGSRRRALASLANAHLHQFSEWASYWDQRLLRQAIIDAPINLTASDIRWVIAMPHLRSIQAIRNAELLLPTDSFSKRDWRKDAPKKHITSIQASDATRVDMLLEKLQRRQDKDVKNGDGDSR